MRHVKPPAPTPGAPALLSSCPKGRDRGVFVRGCAGLPGPLGSAGTCSHLSDDFSLWSLCERLPRVSAQTCAASPADASLQECRNQTWKSWTPAGRAMGMLGMGGRCTALISIISGSCGACPRQVRAQCQRSHLAALVLGGTLTYPNQKSQGH